MRKLLDLLKLTGNGIIQGSYRSYYCYEEIEHRIKKGEKEMFAKLSVNNQFLGEYLLLIKKKEIETVICFIINPENGQPFTLFNTSNIIEVILRPFIHHDEFSDFGKFIINVSNYCPKDYANFKEILKKPIKECPLPTSKNSLIDWDIDNVYQLTQKTKEEIFQIRGIGKDKLKEIELFLKDNGLDFYKQ